MDARKHSYRNIIIATHGNRSVAKLSATASNIEGSVPKTSTFAILNCPVKLKFNKYKTKTKKAIFFIFYIFKPT